MSGETRNQRRNHIASIIMDRCVQTTLLTPSRVFFESSSGPCVTYELLVVCNPNDNKDWSTD